MSVDRRVVGGVVLAAAAVLALLAPSGWNPVRHGADAGFTYGYLPSLARADLDFSDDAIPFDSSMPHTARGHTHNAFPIGPAVWWSPAFVAADGVAAAARVAHGSGEPAGDGRSWPYDLLVGLAALAVGVVGVVATAAAAARVAPRRTAIAAALLVWLAGPAVYYTHAEPTGSHVAGFASVAVVVAVWLAYRDREHEDLTGWHVLALGLLVGFAALCRWQNAVFALGPLVDVATGRIGTRRGRVPALAAFAAGAVAGVAPQLAVWAALYGSPLRPPRGEASGAYLGLADLHLVEVLVSPRHGLYSWHPVLVVATAGLGVLLARRGTRAMAVPLVASIALAAVANASVLDWWAGASFGARRFDGAWPVFAVGLAAVLDRVPRRAAAVAGSLLVLLNWRLVVAYVTGRVSRVESVPVGDLLDAVATVPLAPGALDWGVRKAVWVAVLVAAGIALLRSRAAAWPRPSARAVAAAAVAASTALCALVAFAGWQRGPFDPHAFEAGYFVPQATPPARADRVVHPGQDVWTLVWAFPGFLPPGRYVAVAEDVRVAPDPGASGSLVVRLGGAVVVAGDVGSDARALVGEPFDLRGGFVRLDVEARGAPVHLDLVRLVPAPAAPAGGAAATGQGLRAAT